MKENTTTNQIIIKDQIYFGENYIKNICGKKTLNKLLNNKKKEYEKNFEIKKDYFHPVFYYYAP